MLDIFKRLVLLAVAMSVLLSFASCDAGNGKSADDVAYKLLSAYDDLPQCSQYVKNEKEFAKGYISEESFNNMYTGNQIELSEWDMIDQFRLVVSDSSNLFEIHVIKAVNISDTEIIKKLVEKRAALIENFRKTASGYFTANKADVYVKGKFVFLLVTPDNEKAIKIINKSL